MTSRCAALVAVAWLAGPAWADVTFVYDEAGNLIRVINPDDDPEACGLPSVLFQLPGCQVQGLSVSWLGKAATCTSLRITTTRLSPSLLAISEDSHGEWWLLLLR